MRLLNGNILVKRILEDKNVGGIILSSHEIKETSLCTVIESVGYNRADGTDDAVTLNIQNGDTICLYKHSGVKLENYADSGEYLIARKGEPLFVVKGDEIFMLGDRVMVSIKTGNEMIDGIIDSCEEKDKGEICATSHTDLQLIGKTAFFSKYSGVVIDYKGCPFRVLAIDEILFVKD